MTEICSLMETICSSRKELRGNMDPTPMAKRSKRAQREHYAAKRGAWNGLSPVTRVVQSKKTYDRNRVKRETRRANDARSLRSAPEKSKAAGSRRRLCC